MKKQIKNVLLSKTNKLLAALVALFGLSSCSSWWHIGQPCMYGAPFDEYQNKEDDKNAPSDDNATKPGPIIEHPREPQKLMYGVPYRQFDPEVGHIEPIPEVKPDQADK